MTDAVFEESFGEDGSLAADEPSEPSDHLLLWRFRNGCQEAAQHIYLRYAKRLQALARTRCLSGLGNHLDAADIVQSVFGTFFHGARNGRYDIPAGEDLWKLFLVIALNKIRAEGVFYLAAKRDARLTSALDCLPPSVKQKEQSRGLAEGFLELVVEEALERLPALHRDIVEKRMAGHSVAEIARQLGRSKRSVERSLRDIRSQLSVLLQDQ
jgi:RNA polymerase sigma-70 factor, ECF subfamily